MNTYLEIALRSIAVYIFMIAAIRVFGKKELAQLSVIDLVFILLIANSVQNAMVGPNTSLLGGLIAAGVLFVFNFLLKKGMFRHSEVSKFIQGEPEILIYNGKLNEKNIEKVELTIQELEAAVREHGVEKLEDVNLAVLEVDGNISIISNNFGNRTVKKRVLNNLLKNKS